MRGRCVLYHSRYYAAIARDMWQHAAPTDYNMAFGGIPLPSIACTTTATKGHEANLFYPWEVSVYGPPALYSDTFSHFVIHFKIPIARRSHTTHYQ